MRSRLYILKIALFFVILITSCSKDFLDTKPLGEFSDVDVWKDPALVETFINQIYWRLDEPASPGRLKSNIVDEAHYRGNGASLNFNKGLLTRLAGLLHFHLASLGELDETLGHLASHRGFAVALGGDEH